MEIISKMLEACPPAVYSHNNCILYVCFGALCDYPQDARLRQQHIIYI